MTLTTICKTSFFAMLVCVTALIGACSSDSDSSSSGGGTTAYPEVPTVLPELTGLTDVINTSGGTTTLGSGGRGGDLYLHFGDGRVVPDDGQQRPGIDANFLAPVLPTTTITYADLSSIDPTAFAESGNQAFLELRGQDLFLPAGVTLDLSDAPASVNSLTIQAQWAGDVVRLDGDVVTTRASDPPLGLEVFVHQTQGAAMSVDGMIDTRSGVEGGTAGFVWIQANNGSLIIGGSILTTGTDSAVSHAGAGGGVGLYAGRGDLVLRTGIVRASGGDGTMSGGAGGHFRFYGGTSGRTYFPWGLIGNGGNGGTGNGGTGSSIDLEISGTLDLFSVMHMSSGNSDSGNGWIPGRLRLYLETLTGAVDIIKNGGSSNSGNGGNASQGGWDIYPVNVWGFLMQVESNGGSGNAGGRGGNPSFYGFGGVIANVRIDFEARGGSGITTGGRGGTPNFGGSMDMLSLEVVGNASGGNASGATGTGGRGGDLAIYADGWQGHTIGNATVDFTANGGNGNTGGRGGDLSANSSYGSMSLTADLIAQLNGGTGINGNGGRGGTLDAQSGDVSATLNATLNGGATENGTGGQGGEVELMSAFGQGVFSGTVSARGGHSENDTGGEGGGIEIGAPLTGVVEIVNLDLDVRGGDSDNDDGGDGGEINVAAYAPILLVSGVWNASGGTSDATQGGSGGLIVVATPQIDLDVHVDLIADGGAGISTATAGGGGGQGGTVRVNCARFGSSSGARLRLFALASVNGGSASGTGGVGGNGGVLDIYSAEPSGGGNGSLEIESSAVLTANGGDSAATAGDGGDIFLNSSGTQTVVSGTVHANGGSGVTGGVGGVIWITGFNLTDLFVNNEVHANGGTGSTTGGNGGQVRIGSASGFDEASANIGPLARVRANGGDANGDGGLVDIDVEGTSGANVMVDPAAIIEADEHGTGTPGVVTID
jgi:hypothetical protein